MPQKSISQLQKEIKDFEKKKRDQIKRRELEEKLKRLKNPPKPKRKIKINPILRSVGERMSRSLDRATGINQRPVKRKKQSKPSKSKKRRGDGMIDMFS